jgi:cytochrome c
MKTGSAIVQSLLIAAVTFSGSAHAQDAANGKKVYRRVCMTCHYLPKENKNWFGPSLHGIVNHRSADNPDFIYSTAMKNMNIIWTEDNLDRFLKRPEAVLPSTKMDFAGVSKPEDRSDVIAYLKDN